MNVAPSPSVIAPDPLSVSVLAFVTVAFAASTSEAVPLMPIVPAAFAVSELFTVNVPVEVTGLLSASPAVLDTVRFVNASVFAPVPVIEVAAAGVGVLKITAKPAVPTSGVTAVESCTQLPANV